MHFAPRRVDKFINGTIWPGQFDWNALLQKSAPARCHGMLVCFSKSTPGGGGVLGPIIPIWQEADS